MEGNGVRRPTKEHLIGRREELIQAKRTATTVEGREILVVYHLDTFYALDLHCYHAGSTLDQGDIEEVNKKLCIICPKHKYKIALADGEGIYKARDKDRVFRWFSKGIKQRVHEVTERDGDVFVTLSNPSRFIESDYYYTEQGRKDRAKVDDNMGIKTSDEEDG